MQIFIELMRQVGLPLLALGLVAAPIIVVGWHFSRPKPPYVPHVKRREVAEVGREFMSDHPVQREGDRY